MATYTNSGNDIFGDVPFYTPDFGFLSKVYGTKQAQYDRGFETVKSFYGSILNQELTNPENKKYREDAFKKIQTSIKRLSSVDLSNPTNINEAQKILNPIAQDEDIIYDMYLTRKNNEAKRKLIMHKDSLDPEMRSKYNEYSAMSIQYAEEDLENAKRNDGSIRNVQPGEFVPFDDVFKFLNEQAKENSLKIEYDELKDGYILKNTNGERVSENFSSWALAQMGNRFDRQFDLMGKVESETAIRQLMQQGNYTREEAVNALGAKQKELFINVKKEQYSEIDNALNEYNDRLKILNKLYPKNIPPKYKDEHARLLQAIKILDNEKVNKINDIKTLMNSEDSYIANNLPGFLSESYKHQTAKNWGSTYATTTQKLEIKPDQLFIAKMNNYTKIMLDRENQKIKVMGLRLKQQDMMMRQQLLAGKINKDAPTQEYSGTYVNPNKYSTVNILSNNYKTLQDRTYNTVFGVNGLVSLVETSPQQQIFYKNALNKLKANISTPENLTEADNQILAAYAQLVGITDYNSPVTEEEAALRLEQFMQKTYTKAQENAKVYAGYGGRKPLIDNVQNSIDALTQFKQLEATKTGIYENFKRMNALIEDESGNLREGYEDAEVLGSIGGVNIYDLSAVDESYREALNQSISGSITNMANVVSPQFHMRNLTAGEVKSFLNPNIATVVESSGSLSDDILSGLGVSSIQELIGNEADIVYDAAGQQVIIDVNVKLDSPTASKMKLKQGSLKLSIPYSTVLAHEQSMPAIAEKVKKYSVSNRMLQFSELPVNPNAIYESDEIMSNSGFKYMLARDVDRNGNPGVNIFMEAYNPESDMYESIYSGFLNVDNPNDPSSYFELEDKVMEMSTAYLSGLSSFYDVEEDETYTEE